MRHLLSLERIRYYTSHNTRRLDVEGTIKKIMTTEYIQEALKEAGKA